MERTPPTDMRMARAMPHSATPSPMVTMVNDRSRGKINRFT